MPLSIWKIINKVAQNNLVKSDYITIFAIRELQIFSMAIRRVQIFLGIEPYDFQLGKVIISQEILTLQRGSISAKIINFAVP